MTDPDSLGWDAWAGDAGIKQANAVELGGTPESAIAHVMERVRSRGVAEVGSRSVETVEEIRQGRYRAIIRRRDDGLLEVSLEKWIDGPAEGFPEEGTYWTPLRTALSKTDTLDIARSLARALLEDRN